MSIIRADSIKNRVGNGAPDFPNGITVTGIVTATTLNSVANNIDVDDFIEVGNNIQLGNAGVITATSFVGSGANLTGIDATAVKDSGGNVKIQAQASGAVYTGIHTFTGHTFHQDNDHAKFGTDGDMTIYHDGSNAYLKENTNNMHIGSWSSSSNKGLFLYSAGTNRCAVNNDGHFVPAANNTYDLGNTGARWRNIYTNDLNLSNEDSDGNSVDGTTGNWTIQEGKDELYVINNITGKKYKMMLKEVD
jgi:hypothetical protein